MAAPHEVFYQAQKWARENELDAAKVMLEALWTHSPIKKFYILEALLEIQQKKNVLLAYKLLCDVISGAETWSNFWEKCSQAEQAQFYEWQSQMAFSLKDEIAAIDALQRAAALGRNTLSLWSLLSLLSCAVNDTPQALRSFHRALETYREPALLNERSIGSFLAIEAVIINENFFANLSLMLLPQLSAKEATRVLYNLKHAFPQKDWAKELQEFVAKDFPKDPIGLSGVNYASADKENR